MTDCKVRGEAAVCTTSENVDCLVTLEYDGHKGTLERVFEDGYSPEVGDLMTVFYDPNDPSRPSQTGIKPMHRLAARVVLGVIALAALAMIVVNALLINNKDFRAVQGGIGTIGAIGAMGAVL